MEIVLQSGRKLLMFVRKLPYLLPTQKLEAAGSSAVSVILRLSARLRIPEVNAFIIT